MYQRMTRKIEVTVTPKFLPERSSQEKSYFFWAYTIEISNRSEVGGASASIPRFRCEGQRYRCDEAIALPGNGFDVERLVGRIA